MRAIDGLDTANLSEIEKEHAAKAIECGYLYREDDKLFTKILVSEQKNEGGLYKLSNSLSCGYFENEAKETAKRLAGIFKKVVPEYLHNEWAFANIIASLPIIDATIEYLIEKGVITAPENGIGAEGCWMLVEK